ncbi:MAG TPA: zinc-dependent metalloprotease [Saprospiraceae bacterium]|nr:zinc-dependent metalloprotease [Saprospiraceae bacterium]HMQ83400.1 zinc-dependent metalloprotease [Saprospiraceae bacterium]
MKIVRTLVLVALFSLQAKAQTAIADKVKDYELYEGFFNFYYSTKEGKLLLEISQWDTEFLYVNSLAGGVGSNDLGLDRNQLGESRVVKFIRSGPKVLLLQPNYDYRAISSNEKEVKAVEEAFAQSVLWGFKVEAETEGKVLIDLSDFLLRDAHGVSRRLRDNKQGTYTLDANRSVLSLDRTKNFPKNSEFHALITFSGDPQGGHIRSVTPTPEALTVFTHHSFIELPDLAYQPRVFHPESGYFPLTYFDYATPIDQRLDKRLIRRHRLVKKNPSEAISEAVEPIVYYIDRGVPEPVKSALMEGAAWWNEAFEAAGFKNAFQVKELPEGADPLDVRYNMINWTHRSTRGWSYGSSVYDPRTGEILKGHVLLGSLRVRQDFLIAQGLVEAYATGQEPDPRLEEMALARLRQLSAHEVGHTLGLAHNFAASNNNLASVMDYPHPHIVMDENGGMDYSQAYATGIGEWDKRAIMYGYMTFPEGTDEEMALKKLIRETHDMGLLYISDEGARGSATAHPLAHLWDNGTDAVKELDRMMQLRKKALDNFGAGNIPLDAPMATLEEVLVPLYLGHRYQVEAVAKWIGGIDYNYAYRGDGRQPLRNVGSLAQKKALEALLKTLDPTQLSLSEEIVGLIPPMPIGFDRGRELFDNHTGLAFDPLAAAETAMEITIGHIMNPERLARLAEQKAGNDNYLSPEELVKEILAALDVRNFKEDAEKRIAMAGERILLRHVLQLLIAPNTSTEVKGWLLRALPYFVSNRVQTSGISVYSYNATQAHVNYQSEQIKRYQNDPASFKLPEVPRVPDGSPIGCGF